MQSQLITLSAETQPVAAGTQPPTVTCRLLIERSVTAHRQINMVATLVAKAGWNTASHIPIIQCIYFYLVYK